MKWLALHIDCASAGLSGVCDLLNDCGIEGLVIEDEADFHDFLENNKQYWDYVDEALMEAKKGPTKVSVYLRDDENGREMLLMLRENLAQLKKEDDTLGSLEISLLGIDE